MASIRPHRGKWQARYYDPSGRQRAQAFARKSDAKAFLATVATDKRRGEWVDPRLGLATFGDFAEDWFSTTVHLKPSTRASYEMLLRRYVLPYFAAHPLSRLERVQVQAWVAELNAQGLGAGTVRNAYRVLARVLAEAERSRLIPRNPAADIPLPVSRRDEMRFLSPEEVDRLAEAIEPSHRALILAAAYTGLRWGELAALKVGRLDLLRGAVEVREALSEVSGHIETVATKTGEHRTVPLPGFLCEVLAAHIATYPGEYVFTSSEGGPLRKSFGRRYFKPALRRAGLDEATRFHDLRHSAASIAIGMGANVKQVQQMLGHSSATVTLDTYSHIFPALSEQLKEGLDAAYRNAKADRDVDQMWTKRGPEVVEMAGRKATKGL